MTIAIYTYQNPYDLANEPFWNEVTTCPYFCASQTLANGLIKVYGDEAMKAGISTVKSMVDMLYASWQSTSCIVKQHTVIDNLVNSALAKLESEDQANVARAFLRNREEVFKSIRTLFELNINAEDVVKERLTPEQSFLIELYTSILKSQYRQDFTIQSNFDSSYVDRAIKEAVPTEDGEPSNYASDRIAIHGVHQFTPLMLRAIEEISRHKKVILLFNYQEQYKTVFQSWVDIYSSFDAPIVGFGKAKSTIVGTTVSRKGNVLADNLGKLAEGNFAQIDHTYEYEIIEFDNLTEFAGYVANVYESGRRLDPDNPLSRMKEQFYAADSSANELLKIYFPEQFGERQFLNYPLGHFFIAIANMWSPEDQCVVIDDINDVRECLEAGILDEEYAGQLSAIFGKTQALFEKCTNIDEIIKRLVKLRKDAKRARRSEDKKYLNRIEYFTVADTDLQRLIAALEDLKEIAGRFYEDFEQRPNNFREFYKELKDFLRNDVLDSRQLDFEFADIIQRVLARLEEVENINATASFECLKATMSVYLVQEPKQGSSANWIVRNFEQIDGDILLSGGKTIGGENVTYHFACLSDEDINATATRPFPWPLDEGFFLVAQEPVDWKYQVYVRAKKEYRNFKQYALLYGLEFNRAQYKLSYIKRNGEKEREPFSRLLMLGATVQPFSEFHLGKSLEDSARDEAGKESITETPFDEFDCYRYRICPYRFLLESLIEKETVYKDSFLMTKYLEAVIENDILRTSRGKPKSLPALIEKIDEAYDDAKRYFPFLSSSDRIDISGNLRKRMMAMKPKVFPEIDEDQSRRMAIRELFIKPYLADSDRGNVMDDKFSKVSDSELEKFQKGDVVKDKAFTKKIDLWCKYCANREICATAYAAGMTKE